MAVDAFGAGNGWIGEALHDLRDGARSLRRSPRFALVAVLTLGLGIGAATAIFSVVDTILLRPLPFHQADRLVSVVQRTPPRRPGAPPGSRGFTRHEIEQWRAATRTLSTLAATTTSIAYLRTSQGTARLWGGMVSGNTLPLLGTPALLGRTLVDGDDARPDVVVLSHDTWRQLFQADPDIVGKPAEFLDDEGTPARVRTVVGVMPADFVFPLERMAFFVPLDAGDAHLEQARFSLLRAPLSWRRPRGGAAGRGNRRCGDRRTAARRRAAAARAALRRPQRPGRHRAYAAPRAPGLLRGRGRRLAHRVRQRHQPAPGARRRPASGDGRARGPRRQPRPDRPQPGRRRAGVGRARRSCRHGTRCARGRARTRTGDGRGPWDLQPDVRPFDPAARAWNSRWTPGCSASPSRSRP